MCLSLNNNEKRKKYQEKKETCKEVFKKYTKYVIGNWL